MVHDYLEGNIVKDTNNGQEMKITTVRRGLFNEEPSGYVVCEWEEDGIRQKKEFHVNNIEFVSEGDAKPYDIAKQGSCDSSSKKGLFTLILFFLFGINVNAYDFTVNGLDYDINEDQSTVSVVNYYGGNYLFSTHINIPSYVDYEGNTYIVTKLTGSTFSDCTRLVSVNLPNSIVSIDSYVFNGCTSLTDITLPENLRSIGMSAFRGCSSLSVLSLPNSIEEIGQFAFSDCSNLSEINIPHKLKTLKRGLFSGCTNLTEIEIPQNIKTIETQVFENTSLMSLTIPYGVTEIGDINDCKLLKKIELPNSIISIGSFDGCTSLPSIHLPDSLLKLPSFKKCTGLKRIRIPDNITKIPSSNFSGCSGLKKIIIGNKVTAIGSQAFLNCYNIDTILALNNNPSKSCAFETTVYNRTVLCVPFNSIDSYKSADVWKDFKSIQELKFKLTFTIDNITHSEDSVAFGAPIVYPEIEKKEDHEFVWENVFEEMPTNDLVINGYYKVNTYYLTYVIDGVEYKKEKVVIGTPLNLIDNPTKEGHTFSGWSEIPTTMPEEDVTIIGSFIKNTYKLTYMVDDMVYMSSYVMYNDAIFPMTPPTKEGYTFSGWSEIPKTMPANDVTVEGTFAINSYTLSYVVNGEVYKTMQVEYGATIIPETFAEQEGYTFSGWSEVPETMPAKDVTIEATFTANKYQVVYVVDGTEYATDSITYGETIVVKEVPTKEGHTFSGWNEVPATMPANDVTVEGSFTINSYTLLYTVDSEEYKTITVEYGAEIVPEAEPAKEGYTFSGWSEVPATMPANDVTVEGTFSINSYTLLYTVDGEEYKTVTVEYGAEIVPEAEPAKEGYTFSGWSEILETMPAHDVTIEGTFTKVDGVEVVLTNKLVDVYTLQGVEIREQIPVESLEDELPRGIYIVNGKKVMVK